MKTAEEILKKWYNPLSGIGSLAEVQITEAMKEYAYEVAKEALRNANINKDTVLEDYAYRMKGVFHESLTMSILSENNIPKEVRS